jgi:hypothetical protein
VNVSRLRDHRYRKKIHGNTNVSSITELWRWSIVNKEVFLKSCVTPCAIKEAAGERRLTVTHARVMSLMHPNPPRTCSKTRRRRTGVPGTSRILAATEFSDELHLVAPACSKH